MILAACDRCGGEDTIDKLVPAPDFVADHYDTVCKMCALRLHTMEARFDD